MNRANQLETCAKCHSQIGITTDPDVRLPRSFENYLESTHGKLLKQGNTKVPICIDCHGGHAIRARQRSRRPPSPRRTSKRPAAAATAQSRPSTASRSTTAR